jgi:hypothetical protein
VDGVEGDTSVLDGALADISDEGNSDLLELLKADLDGDRVGLVGGEEELVILVLLLRGEVRDSHEAGGNARVAVDAIKHVSHGSAARSLHGNAKGILLSDLVLGVASGHTEHVRISLGLSLLHGLRVEEGYISNKNTE